LYYTKKKENKKQRKGRGGKHRRGRAKTHKKITRRDGKYARNEEEEEKFESMFYFFNI